MLAAACMPAGIAGEQIRASINRCRHCRRQLLRPPTYLATCSLLPHPTLTAWHRQHPNVKRLAILLAHPSLWVQRHRGAAAAWMCPAAARPAPSKPSQQLKLVSLAERVRCPTTLPKRVLMLLPSSVTQDIGLPSLQRTVWWQSNRQRTGCMPAGFAGASAHAKNHRE